MKTIHIQYIDYKNNVHNNHYFEIAVCLALNFSLKAIWIINDLDARNLDNWSSTIHLPVLRNDCSRVCPSSTSPKHQTGGRGNRPGPSTTPGIPLNYCQYPWQEMLRSILPVGIGPAFSLDKCFYRIRCSKIFFDIRITYNFRNL